MQKNTSHRTEFAAALTQIAHERNLDPQVVMDTIKQALLAAFKKDYPSSIKLDHVYDTDLDQVSGEYRVFETEGEIIEEENVSKVVVKPKAKRVDITPPGFGRIAAQTAKQVILQKIREAEKSAIVLEYEKRLGSLVNGMVLRFIGNEILVDIGKTEAVMPISEQVHSENYHLNQRLTFYLEGIRETVRGREVVVSRASTNLIKELFRREVPEVASGSVEIKAIARDAGSRTKIAVYSTQSGIDPVGSCVGQKGVRVQAVINELNGEKIDIVQFSEDLQKFVAAALSPAEGLSVKINSKTQEAVVTAPQDQLSLAIGREGQNAKLAGKLVGLHHIDIQASKEEKSSPNDTNEQPDN